MSADEWMLHNLRLNEIPLNRLERGSEDKKYRVKNERDHTKIH